MKLHKFHILRITLRILIVIAIIGVSCKKLDNPTEGIKLIVNYDLIKASFSIKFINAKTSEPIGLSDGKIVEITITGQDKDKVLDVTGVKNSYYKYESAGGFFGLSIDPNVQPSEANPVEFTVVAEANGFVNNSIPFSVKSEQHLSLVVQMVEINNPPEGVDVVSDNTGNANNGVVSNDIVLTTDPVSTTFSTSTLTIPKDVVLKDASGTKLNGTLTTSFIYLSNRHDESLASFPGGLITNINTVTNPVLFYSAGYAAIEIKDASGRKAKIIEG
ncbi:MAG: hypothetical protein K8R58_07245, partial [Bacteroidales bacterium]|nr:hypothetical protein [Bacteroidales bacterium]